MTPSIKQTVLTDPLYAAIRLLTEEADSLRECHTRTPDDWTGEPEAKAQYDHILEVVALLSKLRAEGVQAGDEEPPPIIPDDEEIAGACINASDIDGIAYDGPSFERGYRAALASAPVADTLPLEKALYELVDKIAPGLDTGNLVQDARQASTLLGVIMASAAVADQKPIQLSDDVLQFLKDGVADATQCEAADVDQEFADQLLLLIHKPLYTEPLADNREPEWGPLVIAPVAGEAKPVAWMVDWPDEPDLGHTLLEDPVPGARNRALVIRDAAPQASTEPLARYCPGCGSVGSVGDEYRDCCPDGNQARMIPARLAEQCRDTFRLAIQTLLADAAANDRAAPRASDAVRILFPTHLRKMWSGGEVQAWLDNHQGITPPTASAKGSLERYRDWRAEQAEADKDGVRSEGHQ